ncbi:hypothetical protein Pelo_8495 [Pelomyxa schiedti]|nr:hypothetical protein Pelo_8495 [Pelomyxa schiedti]
MCPTFEVRNCSCIFQPANHTECMPKLQKAHKTGMVLRMQTVTRPMLNLPSAGKECILVVPRLRPWWPPQALVRVVFKDITVPCWLWS